MNRSLIALMLCSVIGCAENRMTRNMRMACDDPVMGNWSARLPYETMNACSIIFDRGQAGEARALVLWRWGSPEYCSEVKVDGSHFSFIHPYGQRFEGVVLGDRLFARIAPCDRKTHVTTGCWLPFEGWRNPEIVDDVKTSEARLGAPVDLLANGLDDWVAMDADAKFGWKFKDGILSNALGLKSDGSWADGGVNLMTKRADFYDFNLEYDVRLPARSNSGVYLRGRFEVQAVDSFGMRSDKHSMASYYGREKPRVSVEKPAGEWQHVSVTLYKGHITIVLNGVPVIENAKITGVTGGAIDANLHKPGPIYLQGDHSDADYKNMILRPAL